MSGRRRECGNQEKKQFFKRSNQMLACKEKKKKTNLELN